MQLKEAFIKPFHNSSQYDNDNLDQVKIFMACFRNQQFFTVDQ